MIGRRALLAMLGGSAICLPWTARAQQRSLPVIGYLGYESAAFHPEADAFLGGLRDQGYEEGGSILIEYRWAAGDQARLAPLAAELAARDVALIVAFEPGVTAAMRATRTIPIVMRSTDDPVRLGYVASLAHPGGNVTGVTSFSGALYGKRLEIVHELLPSVRRLGLLFDPSVSTASGYLAATEAAAKPLGFDLVRLEVRTPADISRALEAASGAGVGAILPLRSPVTARGKNLIVDLTRRGRIPAIYDERSFVEAGGLISYGANLAQVHRRAAYFVARILKGAEPANLPIEEPTQFEMLVHEGTARAIGLTIPPSLLARADAVIQ